MDGRKVAEDIEGGLWRWASALLPLLTEALSAVVGLLRRFLLAMLGGVPNEQVPTKAGVGVEREADGKDAELRPEVAPPSSIPTSVPRWRDRLVRDCLRRISQSQPLRERHLDQLPADVAHWLRELRPEDADSIKHLPTEHLRQQHLLWAIGGEMIGTPSPPATGKEVEVEAPEPPQDGPRR